MSDLMLDVDQAGELKAAFRRGNWTNQEIKRLCEGGTLAQFRQVLLGQAAIIDRRQLDDYVRALAEAMMPQVKPEHIIDCDANPYLPDGWKGVEAHQKAGQLTWDKDAQKDALYLSELQKKHPWLQGHKLREELSGKPVLNANVLDYLLAHPELIPEEWKGKYVFFWGTIYRYSGGNLFVRYLYWLGGRWDWSDYWLDLDWGVNHPAALRAN
ncbi:MAG: hypothetical protein Q8P36_00705 [bacterium]|nr:hypothetical protein [bacterium]